MAAKSDGTIGGLDINRTNICYTRCLPDSKLIANVCIQPLEVTTENYWESVHSSFNDFLKDFKIPGENIVSSLPGEYAILKKIILDKEETAVDESIEWELSQQIVGSIDEYVYDYQRLADTPEGDFQRFLVVGYRNAAIERISKLLKSNKLNPIIIDLDIFALINVYEINYEDRKDVPALIIFSDPYKTKLILTAQGNFIDIEIFEHAEQAQSSDGYVHVLDETMKRLLHYNAKVPKLNNTKAYITGSYFSRAENTETVLKKIENVELLYPFRRITCSAGLDEEKLKEFAPLLAVSVGLALRDID